MEFPTREDMLQAHEEVLSRCTAGSNRFHTEAKNSWNTLRRQEYGMVLALGVWTSNGFLFNTSRARSMWALGGVMLTGICFGFTNQKRTIVRHKWAQQQSIALDYDRGLGAIHDCEISGYEQYIADAFAYTERAALKEKLLD